MILFLSHRVPHPPDIGLRIRQRNLLEALASVAPVQLVFAYDRDDDLDKVSALAPLCERIHPVLLECRRGPKRPSIVSLGDGLRQTGRLLPRRSRWFFSSAVRQVVEDVAPHCRLLHVDALPMATHVQRWLGDRHRQPWMVLDLDDVEVDVARERMRLAPADRLRERIVQRFDLALLRREQGQALRSFDRVLVASERDRGRLGGGPELCVIPNGAEIGRGPLPDDADEPTLLLVGTWDYWPNRDGLRYFVEEILPHVRHEVPGVRVLVVGRDVPDSVACLHDGDRIFVSSNVPDVEPFYRRARACVVPLRLGGGTRIKILEAFALGRPVISTTVGCSGLEVEPETHLLVADGPADFARCCVRLLRDPGLRSTLAGCARDLVERRYGWGSVRRGMAELATSLLAHPRRPS